jgi:hypothetical protein
MTVLLTLLYFSGDFKVEGVLHVQREYVLQISYGEIDKRDEYDCEFLIACPNEREVESWVVTMGGNLEKVRYMWEQRPPACCFGFCC